MDLEGKKFGGVLFQPLEPRELTGAGDLIRNFKLLPHYEFFCKRSLPESVLDTHYLYNVVGDTEIRKGDNLQLDQLIQNPSFSRDTTAHIRPFDLDTLKEAFQLREIGSVDLSPAEKGAPATVRKSKDKDKEKKHKKHKDRDKEKDKEHKKHKHRHKDRSKDKDKEKRKDKSGHHDSSADYGKKDHEKKRKHDGDEDLIYVHKHKKVSTRAQKSTNWEQ